MKISLAIAGFGIGLAAVAYFLMAAGAHSILIAALIVAFMSVLALMYFKIRDQQAKQATLNRNIQKLLVQSAAENRKIQEHIVSFDEKMNKDSRWFIDLQNEIKDSEKALLEVIEKSRTSTVKEVKRTGDAVLRKTHLKLQEASRRDANEFGRLLATENKRKSAISNVELGELKLLLESQRDLLNLLIIEHD